MKAKLKRSLALIIAFAMIISMLPSNLIVAKATESAGTVVYLKDTIGGETRTLTETTSDATKGWAWDAETATLTLSGFNGEYIEADGALNIVLNGTNTITIPSSGGTGIKGTKDLTIDDTTSKTVDILNIKVENATSEISFVGVSASATTIINGGTVNLIGTTKSGSLYGLWNSTDVYNDAVLNIDLSDEGNNAYISACNYPLSIHTSSPVSVSVNSSSSNSRAMHSCYYYGTGALSISALGNAKAVYSTFSVDSAASGPVNVKGYISGKGFNTGKWKVKGYDNYIWYNNVSGQEGTYLLCDSNGNPIKDLVIEKYDSLPLRFMDSTCFDVPSMKVGEDYYGKGIYPIYGCEGGTGDYRFALADDSAPLPDGLSINKYYGYISGTATSVHPAGTAKIKVTSGSESATFEISYGAVTEADYNLTIDGTEYSALSDGSGTGWSYESDTKILTLNGYNGGPIASEKGLDIVLNGTNTITIPSSGGTGIKGTKDLTIDDTTSKTVDILNIKVENATSEISFVGVSASATTIINGGTVNLIGTTKSGSLYGLWNSTDVYNDAVLNIDLSDEGNNAYISACNYPLSIHTSSPVSVSVNSLSSNSRAMHSCYYYGTGALSISALGNAEAVYSTFSVDSAASGPVNVKGYISGKGFNTGKWKVKGYDNYIWYNNVSGQEGTYLLCDSNGNPIKDPVIEKYNSLPLRFMDSTCFDVPSMKVGENYYGKGIYPIYGCEGGTGTYRFALAEDSAPLPEGLSIDQNYGYITGTATSIHPAGTAKIKVTSGSESATFEINYGAVTYKNPVTGVSLDKEEIILNKGESKELTATVLPDTADNCDVSWKVDSSYISLNEDDDESTNTRKATVEAKSYADTGVYNVTVTTDVGSFQKTCKVYVKEVKPAGEVDGDYIIGLKANAGYTVNGVAKTADNNGRILIDDSWRLTTVSIVKTNTEAKCNSDVQELEIGAKSISSGTVTLEYTSVDYDGTAKVPAVTVKYGDVTLTETTDYTLEYSNNTNVGTAKVTVTGTGLYSGTVEKTFTIMPIEMTGITVSAYIGVYDGNPHTVTVTGLPDGATITYSAEYDGEYVAEAPQRTEAGETRVYYKIVKANYKTIESQVTICVVGTDIADADVVVSPDTYTFDGIEKEPAVAVSYSGTELVEGTDYTVAYENNVNAGTAKVIVTGKGGYEGTVEKTFTINPKSITPTVTLSKTAYTYNGKVQKPTVTVKDGENVLSSADYTVAYASGSTNAGSYKVTVTLKGNYSGSATATYTIKAKAITPTVTLSKTTYTYNGKVQKPTVTVKDGSTTLAATNYTVTYASGCTNAGSYKVTVTLKGNYSGSATATYTIKAKAITPTVTLSKTTYTYNGKVQKPTVTVKNGSTTLAATNYTVTYASGCTNAGTYKVTVTLKGNYSGSATATYTIKAKAVTPKVTLSKTTYTYNGKAQKPTVTVKIGTTKLSSSNYTVTYASGRKNVGKYKVTVKLKGNYSGSVSKTFTINPKATTLSKLTAGTKKLTVTWKKLATQTSGYQIQYSTSSSFKSPKTVTVSKNTTTKKTISSLKSGKKYYVRIRTYKTVKVSGKSTKIYSSWSKLMSVKVK